jgi:hypothetical protein
MTVYDRSTEIRAYFTGKHAEGSVPDVIPSFKCSASATANVFRFIPITISGYTLLDQPLDLIASSSADEASSSSPPDAKGPRSPVLTVEFPQWDKSYGFLGARATLDRALTKLTDSVPIDDFKIQFPSLTYMFVSSVLVNVEMQALAVEFIAGSTVTVLHSSPFELVLLQRNKAAACPDAVVELTAANAVHQHGPEFQIAVEKMFAVDAALLSGYEVMQTTTRTLADALMLHDYSTPYSVTFTPVVNNTILNGFIGQRTVTLTLEGAHSFVKHLFASTDAGVTTEPPMMVE